MPFKGNYGKNVEEYKVIDWPIKTARSTVTLAELETYKEAIDSLVTAHGPRLHWGLF